MSFIIWRSLLQQLIGVRDDEPATTRSIIVRAFAVFAFQGATRSPRVTSPNETLGVVHTAHSCRFAKTGSSSASR